ncbi:unnamed protein product [Caenorhabditis angaria]|uniref:Uncharacterized protein n=1 Tax=Caenorhabditis angaria TaxID=860376 RepID=A0A9P1I5S7_9PELO|nr:unnamed protein product [Caenorhabditis angaria]
MRLPLNKKEIFVLFLGILFLVLGIVTWSTFATIYLSGVKANLQFFQNKDTSLGLAAFQYTHPAMTNIMKFYFFNLTNPDEVKYNAAKPCLVEIGPFAVRESEEKKYIEFNGDSTQMFYQNYKKYILNKENSCEDCDWNMNLLFPNPPGLGAVGSMIDPRFNITKTGRTIIAIGLTLLGEYPFTSHKVREVLFDGYEDPFLSAAHSGIISIISGIYAGPGKSIIPIPVPEMKKFGYFQGYNNSRDEEYWVETGKRDTNKIGKIDKWGGQTKLPADWWTTDFARQIRGSDSGSFTQMHLTEESTSDFFFSFMCRSFTKTYYSTQIFQSIPTLGFHVGYDEWDTTSDKNIGFRYRNVEKRNYFPDWPSCPPKGQCKQSGSIDCSKSENFCHACCDGSHYNGTYLLPPGMFPLVCYPGRLQPSPFSVIYSPPHYLFSPPETRTTVIGMNPDQQKHEPMIYFHEPFSGTTLQVTNRLQVNMPVIKSHDVPSSQNMPNVVIPLFWQESIPVLDQFIYNTAWFGFVLVPRLVTIIQFVEIVIGILLIVVIIVFRYRRREKPFILTNHYNFENENVN